MQDRFGQVMIQNLKVGLKIKPRLILSNGSVTQKDKEEVGFISY